VITEIISSPSPGEPTIVRRHHGWDIRNGLRVRKVGEREWVETVDPATVVRTGAVSTSRAEARPRPALRLTSPASMRDDPTIDRVRRITGRVA
jgi:hypothetical protein